MKKFILVCLASVGIARDSLDDKEFRLINHEKSCLWADSNEDVETRVKIYHESRS